MIRQTLSKEVYDWLLRRLFNNDLRPGDRLNRREAARQFGVSVAPVLEAMVQLELEGFLETIPRRGTRVREIDENEVRGRLIVRQALECQAARMYCGAVVRNARPRLVRLAEAVDRTHSRSPHNWNAEVAFHRGLMELADCRVLLESFDLVMKHSLFYAHNRVLTVLPKDKSIPDAHQRLVAALQTPRPDEAEQAMRQHIQARLSLGRAGEGQSVAIDLP